MNRTQHHGTRNNKVVVSFSVAATGGGGSGPAAVASARSHCRFGHRDAPVEGKGTQLREREKRYCRQQQTYRVVHSSRGLDVMGNTQGAEQPGKCGYRVLGVQPNSPASKVGLVSFFDFIIGADGEMCMLCFVSCFVFCCVVFCFSATIARRWLLLTCVTRVRRRQTAAQQCSVFALRLLLPLLVLLVQQFFVPRVVLKNTKNVEYTAVPTGFQ